jgi:enoyl-CoA hydratase/carnithine racemase
VSNKATFTEDGALGILTLQNPPRNQLDLETIDDVTAAVAEAEQAAGMRALLIRGDGPMFSAGADVTVFANQGSDQLRPLIATFLDLGHSIEGLSVPTLAAVHGACMAGGFELALFCDLIWAAAGTVMGLPETKLGIVPLAGGIQRIAMRAGIGRARTIALGGAVVPAERFAEWGVIDNVLPAEELRDGPHAFARELANGPTLALSSAKQIARAYVDGGTEAADREQVGSPVDLFDTEDAKRAIAHYIEHHALGVEFGGT